MIYMNREFEYINIKNELENLPEELSYTVEKARKRLRRRNLINGIINIPLIIITSLFLVFTTLVNLSPTFAHAFDGIPFLNKLKDVFSVANMISKVMENNYGQEVYIEQTQGDLTIKINYIIADVKQLYVFYTLRPNEYEQLVIVPEFYDKNTNEKIPHTVDGHVARTRFYYIFKNEMDKTHYISFETLKMPVNIVLKMKVVAKKHGMEETLYFSFDIDLNSGFIKERKKYEINKEFELTGNKFTLVSYELFPTHTKMIIKADDDNKQSIYSLDFYIEDDKGNRYYDNKKTESVGNYTYYYTDPAYFNDCKELKLCIREVIWVDEFMPRMKVDLKNNTVLNKPGNIDVLFYNVKEGVWKFKLTKKVENTDSEFYNTVNQNIIRNGCYIDKNDNKYYVNFVNMSQRFEDFTLEGTEFETQDYYEDELYLEYYVYGHNAFDPYVVVK